MSQSMIIFLAAALRPIGYFLLLVILVLPIKYCLNKIIPDGRIKTFLFHPYEERTKQGKRIYMVVAISILIGFYALLGVYIHYAYYY